MKKIFTLTMLLVMAMTVSAQDVTYRKSWDFTKWSATTVANLKAESAKGPTTGAWSDVEKNTATEPTELSKDNCFWEVTAQGNATEPATLTANGEVIAELEGLGYTNTTARSLAIAVNYQVANANDAAFGPYQGASYLWLGSKTKNYFVIPHVAPGTTIKIGVESHKTSEARGLELYVGLGNSGTQLKDPDGNAVPAPTTYMDQEWLLPAEGLTEEPNEDGTYDIQIRNTNGCHIYYITVGEGDTPAVEEAKKVAYIVNGDYSQDFIYTMLDGNEKVALTAIDIATAPTLETLADYDVVAFSPSLTAEQAEALKQFIAFIPVVNFNTALYEAWGFGEAVATQSTALTVLDPKNAIFDIEGFDVTAGIDFGYPITGVSLNGYFMNDDVIATAGESVVGIHAHNAGRNAYYLVPMDAEQMAADNIYIDFIPKVISVAAKTKRAVTAVNKPIITFTQEDGRSIVSIAAANSTAIYYTTDGSDPKENGTLYADEFDVTSNVTVKAYAVGDGYLDSETAEKEVTIATKAEAPTFTLERINGQTTVTINAAEGTKAYFNFNGAETAALSQAYTEPIVLTEPTFIYTLADGEGMLTSDLNETFVGIDGIDASNIRMDEIAHFTASEEDWYINDTEILPDATGSASAYYFWGKSAWNFYSEEVDHEEVVKDKDGNVIKSVENPDKDSVIVYYKPNPDAMRTVMPLTETPWRLRSAGQVLTGELQLAPAGGVGNGATGRYAEEAIDLIDEPTKGVITFGAKVSGEPYTGAIETTEKFAGPFDVIVICGNGNGSGKGELNVEVSDDQETWVPIGDVKLADTQRYFKRTRLVYEETAPVYVRVAQNGGGSKAQVYDIILRNNGEVSKQYNEQEMTGISEVAQPQRAKTVSIYSLNGVRQQQLSRGLNIVIDANGNVRKVMGK